MLLLYNKKKNQLFNNIILFVDSNNCVKYILNILKLHVKDILDYQ